MKIGFIGLGKMGFQIVVKLMNAGHEVVVFDVNTQQIDELKNRGAIATYSKQELIDNLGESPIIWLMIPANYVNDEIRSFAEILPENSLVIDGGNSNYLETKNNADFLNSKNISMIDIGTSGGIMGLDNGFSLMVGGVYDNYEKITPLLEVLASPSGGFEYVGPSGCGHYVKMVHNGIEYGMMQALAEGYWLLKDGPEQNIPIDKVARVWQKGSIVQSKLNELIETILSENTELQNIDGYVADSGEGVWTLETADNSGINMPVLRESIAIRKSSQQGNVNYSTKLLAALRNKFGGHNINKENG